MSFGLKSRKLRRLIAVLVVAFLIAVTGFLTAFGPYRKLDYQVLDGFYKQAVKGGHGPEMSTQIVYLVINDETYDYFGKNIL
ncbi:MAG: hypothetical protein JRJ85_07380, partial [Deltaproteobacteria bacterium]|nr:hypothetical protein [Deltaproteobacteria bacterium]